MKLITVVTTPAIFEPIKDALGLFGVRGMTVAEVTAIMDGPGKAQIYRGLRYRSDMRLSLRIELAVPDDEAYDLMRVIHKILATSDPGGSSLWSSPIEILARLRTGEYGIDAR